MKTFLPIAALALTLPLLAADYSLPTTRPGDQILVNYFKHETESLAARTLNTLHSPDFTKNREEYRRQLAEMLGLDPMPEKTDLHPVITGKIETSQYTVEKLYFQSRPHLYVTANLYIPKNLSKPAPAIIYVCGHATTKKNGIPYGSKTVYQHHGAWFARNGYVCIIPDTLQLGEIEGIHHGLHHLKMWWWLSRGYTPAGVEAWNSIRCIDYLQSRPEVDKEKIGITGRSGGGAYSWWTAALDKRIKCAVPVAGITDLHNHVIDGTIEGHCDCMFFVNTYRWDFPMVSALVSPRPLLLGNSDKDTIFPLDGIERLHRATRDVYRSDKADANFGLLITEGPHKDTQDLQVPAFRWFNRFFKNNTDPIKDAVADKPFDPEQLRVFKRGAEPKDQINTRIHETFVPMAPAPQVPDSEEAWTRQRTMLLASIQAKTFMEWPQEPGPLNVTRDRSGISDLPVKYTCTSQPDVYLSLRLSLPKDPAAAKRIGLVVGGTYLFGSAPTAFQLSTKSFFEKEPSVGVSLSPRGLPPYDWTSDEKKQTHIRRRFALLGTTLESMQAYDIRRALQAIRSIDELKNLPITIHAEGNMAAIALYASLFEPPVAALELTNLPPTHNDPNAPQFLNILKTLDLPTAVALAADRQPVHLSQPDAAPWSYPAAVAKKLSWPADRFTVIVTTHLDAKPSSTP